MQLVIQVNYSYVNDYAGSYVDKESNAVNCSDIGESNWDLCSGVYATVSFSG